MLISFHFLEIMETVIFNYIMDRQLTFLVENGGCKLLT